MSSFLLIVAGIAVGVYGSFCSGADWARRRSDLMAKNSHRRALERRRDLLRQLDVLEDGRHRHPADERRRLVEAIKRADKEVERALAVVNHTGYDVLAWSPWMPWASWLTWKERAESVLDWWRGRRALAAAREAWRSEVSGPLSEDDRRMCEQVKREVLGSESSED